MVHVLATIQVAAGKRDEFLRHFHALLPTVQAERGCLEYGPAIDLPTDIPAQAELRHDTVVVVEKWESLAALQAHLDAAHMHAFRESVQSLVVTTELRILCPA
jgi:quinol monooxygenase YgiN